MSAEGHSLLPSFHIGDLEVNPGPSFVGLGVQLVLFVLLILVVRYWRTSKVAVLFDTLFESVFDFFEDILGKGEQYRVKSFVVTLFFIILFSNVLGIVFEIFGPMFGIDEVGHPLAAKFFGIPTADLNFNIALATISVILMMLLQIKHGAHMTFKNAQEKIETIGALAIFVLLILAAVMGVLGGVGIGSILIGILILSLVTDRGSHYLANTSWGKNLNLHSGWLLGITHAVHEYIPVTGNNILEVEQGDKPRYTFYPMRLFVKAFDVGISLFLGALEIIGLFAKILSLSFRLYGNMISGGILLGILLAAMSGGLESMFGYKITAVFPVIVYLQEILVALIQALVFPLLVAIFFKVAQTANEA